MALAVVGADGHIAGLVSESVAGAAARQFGGIPVEASGVVAFGRSRASDGYVTAGAGSLLHLGLDWSSDRQRQGPASTLRRVMTEWDNSVC